MSHDPRHPHLSPGYFAKQRQRRGNMAAWPQSVEAPPSEMKMTASVTFAPGANVEVKPASDLLPGQAYEEMTVVELRDVAKKRGVPYRSLSKAVLIKRLRQ